MLDSSLEEKEKQLSEDLKIGIVIEEDSKEMKDMKLQFHINSIIRVLND